MHGGRFQLRGEEAGCSTVWQYVPASIAGRLEEALRSGREAGPNRGTRDRERRQDHRGAGRRGPNQESYELPRQFADDAGETISERQRPRRDSAAVDRSAVTAG